MRLAKGRGFAMVGVNWRRGTLRLWIVSSSLWCLFAFAIPLTNTSVTWFSSDSPATIHVKISNSETWDYPAEWGVQRIRDDLRKRLAQEDEKDREWAAQLSLARKAECRAIPDTTSFDDEPADCVRLLFANDIRAVPQEWEVQVRTPSVPAWSAIAAAVPWAVGPPLVVLALGALLLWALAGFRRADDR
jgi:hypothetical protein